MVSAMAGYSFKKNWNSIQELEWELELKDLEQE